jgi:predicted nucleic acid-binding protein
MYGRVAIGTSLRSSGHEIALPFAVVGELKVLPIRAKWGADKRRRLESDIGLATVLPATAAVVDQWSELSARFLDRLKSGGVNDMWIAASCLVHGLPLATGNLTDFQTIKVEFPSLTLIHLDL